ncbi:MAG: polysaccharide export protein [Lachnospiraceae bacterium]|nr:polysaccharide export protein [Lachnospiraceae bacterium]
MSQVETIIDREDEDEIDLLELLMAIKQHLFAVILSALICGGAALLIAIYLVKPIYSSESTMLVIPKETALSSLADIQMGTSLTKDYQVLITSRPVLEEVLFNLNINMNYTALKGMINISNPSNTRIIAVKVNYTDPVIAMQLVNELARVSSLYIGDKMEVVPPKIIEEGIVPTRRSSPSYKKYLMIGAAIGILLSCGVIVLLTIMNDTINTENDVARYLDIPMLAGVPDRKDFINKQNKSRKKSKKDTGWGDKKEAKTEAAKDKKKKG